MTDLTDIYYAVIITTILVSYMAGRVGYIIGTYQTTKKLTPPSWIKTVWEAHLAPGDYSNEDPLHIPDGVELRITGTGEPMKEVDPL